MARAHGAPDFPFAVIDWPFASLDMVTGDDQIDGIVTGVTGQVERILLGQPARPAASTQETSA